MSKQGAAVLTVFLIFVFGIFGSLFHAMNVEDARREQREREWLVYSQQHQCKVVRDPGSWDAGTLWECAGGFQVRRQP